jgi:hypothetical protein
MTASRSKMRRQIAAAACSALLCSAILGFAALSSVAVAQQRTVTAEGGHVSIKDLMDAIVDPSADVLWGAVGTVVDREGVHEASPKTPEEWLELRRAAVRIIEGGNLLMMPGRVVAPAGTRSEVPGVELEPEEIAALIDRDRPIFDAFAKELGALGLEALQATERRNTALLLDVGSRMQDACESCHKTFWYPNETLPPRK